MNAQPSFEPESPATGRSFKQLLVDLWPTSRLVPLASTQNLELRLEVFNLLNNFNWGNPNLNFNAGTFGRITTSASDPRVLQFGIKYGF